MAMTSAPSNRSRPNAPRGLITRVRDRIRHERRQKALPAYRRQANLRDFHDALDAASLLEDAVGAFGYSFRNLEQRPLQPPLINDSGRQMTFYDASL